MAAQTPFEVVQRRLAEGVPVEALQVELLDLGLDRAEIARVEGEAARALAKKMKVEGFPPEAIAEELQRREYSPEDIHALLLGEGMPIAPPQPSAVGGAAEAAQLIFGVLVLVTGLLLLLGDADEVYSEMLSLVGGGNAFGALAARSRRRARQGKAQAKLATLAPDDPQARCAMHPEIASLGSCPRCGSFCCVRCTPLSGLAGGTPCMRCQAKPEVRDARLRRASRVAALALLVAPLTTLLITQLDRSLSKEPSGLAFLLAGSVPWLLLALAQTNVRGRWPMVVSSLPWLLIAFLFLAGGHTLELVVWLIPLGTTLYGLAMSLAARRVHALVRSYRTIGPIEQSETSSSA